MRLNIAIAALWAASAAMAAPITNKCKPVPAPTPTATTPAYQVPNPTSTPAPPAIKKNSMTVLATNDIHTHLDQFNSGGTDCREKDIVANKCYGGAARIQHVVNEFRSKNDNVVLLDAGDQFQGTLFFEVFGGRASADIMNQLGYSAMSLGNHEFDKGVDTLVEFVKELDFPVVNSNIDMSTAPALSDAGVKPYTILEEYGVGVIGYITNTTASITTGAKDIVFRNPAPVVQEYIDELHAKGIKRIICVSHNGYDHDQYLAQNTRGISLIVGGHSHSLLHSNSSLEQWVGPYPTKVTNLDGKSTYIVQSHRYGDYLGHVQLEWDPVTHDLVNLTGESILLDQAVPIHEPTHLKVQEWKKAFEQLTKQIVGFATADFPNDGCKAGECAIGNLIADSMLDAQRSVGGQIAFTNSGGIRAGISQGNISYADVITILPFGNLLVQFDYTGAEVKQLLERVAAGVTEAGLPVVSIPQWSGIQWSYNPALPAYSRVVSADLINADGTREPIDASKTYKMVTSDFVTGGGDNIIPKVEKPVMGLSQDVVLNQYLGKVKTVTPKIEGRFTKV
ncbi:Metallo-dependent phosphatase-like protein [Gaertneriomyces semiglobifer]|nr:Metallo-dependent phosphatase-like protein [Gaertneriomyces semiglobifer]